MNSSISNKIPSSERREKKLLHQISSTPFEDDYESDNDASDTLFFFSSSQSLAIALPHSTDMVFVLCWINFALVIQQTVDKSMKIFEQIHNTSHEPPNQSNSNTMEMRTMSELLLLYFWWPTMERKYSPKNLCWPIKNESLYVEDYTQWIHFDIWAFFIFPFLKNSWKTATYSHGHARIHMILNFRHSAGFSIQNERVSRRIFSSFAVVSHTPSPIDRFSIGNISYVSCIRIFGYNQRPTLSYSIHASCKTIIVIKTFQINMKSLRVHCAVIWLVELLLPLC